MAAPDPTPVPGGSPLPATLAARPYDARRGLPVPPVNVHPDPVTGVPMVDFTTINTTTSTRLAGDRRCSLCGALMPYWVAFLGAPRAAQLRQYTDPPGCPDFISTTWPQSPTGDHAGTGPGVRIQVERSQDRLDGSVDTLLAFGSVAPLLSDGKLMSRDR